MKNVDAFAEQWKMLPPGETVLVAVSGGVDSMCLLHWLRCKGVPLVAAHFNHRLRGAASDGDAAFVADYCRQNGVRCIVGAEEIVPRGESVEEAARRQRYAFLERTADEVGARRIATAHHARDCAETVLWNLARGTGADGLGIPPVRGRIIRPLLLTAREEIERYARENRIPYRVDASNADERYTRNYLRARVLPCLREVNPVAEVHIAQAAQRLLRESAYLDALAQRELTHLRCIGGEVSLPCADLLGADEVLRVRMLRQMLSSLPVGKKDFTAAHWDALVALAAGRKSAQLDLPHGVRASCTRDVLTLALREREPLPRTALPEGVSVLWGDYELRWEYGIAEAGTVCLVPGGDLSVGTWDARGRMTVLPAQTPRSLKRLFVEAGIAPEERDRTPVLYLGERAAFVPGIGIHTAAAAADGERCRKVILQKRKT